jgi:hypothetical protein
MAQLAMDRLGASETHELASLLRFLFHSTQPADADEMVASIREQIRLETFDEQDMVSSLPSLCSVLSRGLRNDHVLQPWLHQVVEQHIPLSDLDLIVLVQTFSHHVKPNARCVVQLVKQGNLVPDSMHALLMRYHHYLPMLLNQSLVLGKKLLLAGEVDEAVLGVIEAVYVTVFCLGDAYYAREVIDTFVTHTGGGSVMELKFAARLLGQLVASKGERLLQFLPIIKGVLDYLVGMPLECIKALVFALCCLCTNQVYHCICADWLGARTSLSSRIVHLYPQALSSA